MPRDDETVHELTVPAELLDVSTREWKPMPGVHPHAQRVAEARAYVPAARLLGAERERDKMAARVAYLEEQLAHVIAQRDALPRVWRTRVTILARIAQSAGAEAAELEAMRAELEQQREATEHATDRALFAEAVIAHLATWATLHASRGWMRKLVDEALVVVAGRELAPTLLGPVETDSVAWRVE